MAKINFSEQMKKSLSLSELMKDREKMETETLINLHANGVTITDFDVCEINGETVACYITKEEPRHFHFAGKLLKDRFDEFIEVYDGDIDKCREDFREQGGVRVKLERARTRENREITKVTVL